MDRFFSEADDIIIVSLPEGVAEEKETRHNEGTDGESDAQPPERSQP